MTTLRRACENERGLTIVETVFAAVILLVFVTSAVSGMVFAVRTVTGSGKRTQATQIASQQIEKIRTLPFDSVGTVSPGGSHGNPAGSVLSPETVGNFEVTTQISWVYDGTRVSSKLVKVIVSWDNPQGSIQEQTRVYGKTALINIGTLQVFTRDWDSANGISGAAITVQPVLGGDPYVDSSDENGQRLFGALAPGEYDTTASAFGYLPPAPGTVGRASVPADGFTQTTVRLQRQSSIAIVVTDDASQPISGATVHMTGPYSYVADRTTGADGRATFSNLYVGQYSFSVAKVGYTAAQGTATVSTGNEQVEAMVQLVPGGDLVVVVKDENGVSISQPAIEVRGPEPSSDQVPGSPFTGGTNGQLSITGMDEGTYTVTAAKAGYTPGAPQTAVVLRGQTTTLNIVLQRNPYGQLQIKIQRSNGNPRVNYRIRVTGPNGFDRNNLYTDANGIVLLADLLAGNYRIYAPYSSGTYTTAVVSSGQLTQITLIKG